MSPAQVRFFSTKICLRSITDSHIYIASFFVLMVRLFVDNDYLIKTLFQQKRNGFIRNRLDSRNSRRLAIPKLLANGISQL